jgi:hypothetical protein
MKKILLSSILVICFVAVTSIHVSAQQPAFAKVTVYTDSRQNVGGYLYLNNLTYSISNWNMSFHFNPNEGQAVDGGYMYQKWVLLTGFGFFIPVGDLYEMEIDVNLVAKYSDTYAPDRWPQYLQLPGIDFRSQGGQ